MIIGLLGTMGNAKTLSTVFLGSYWKNITHIDRVVANFNCEIATDYVHSPRDLDRKTEEFKEKNITAIYLLDEIWAWMNSRKSAENDLMTEIVLNSRKRGAVIVWTSQRKGLVDLNLTENTDYFGACQHYKKHMIEEEHDLAVLQLVKNSEPPETAKKFRYNAETFYNTYDTDEEVSTVSDKDQHSDLMVKIMKKFLDGTFESKKDAHSFLVNNDALGSQGKAERFVSEAVTRLKLEDAVRRDGQKYEVLRTDLTEEDLNNLVEKNIM